MAMNILEVRFSLYYHFQSTSYTTKVTDAVKLFSPHLRRRIAVKPYGFQTWPEDRGYTVCSNDAIICNCVNWQFCASIVLYPYVYLASKWSLFANSVTYSELDYLIMYHCYSCFSWFNAS